VDRGIKVSEYRYQKADVYLGSIAADIVAWFIIVCTAATLYPLVSQGLLKVETTTQIAQALSIPLGHLGTVLFAAGLLAASLLAAAVLPLATAYTWCDAFGWEIGLQKTAKQAPLFYGLFSAALFIGAGVVLIPGVNPLSAMLISQNLNGMLLPVVLIFMLKLVNDRRLMREYVNGFWSNVVAWTTVVILIALTVILLTTGLLGLA
jgi:Mn2+/Fe2+ NRAMP family transporter